MKKDILNDPIISKIIGFLFVLIVTLLYIKITKL